MLTWHLDRLLRSGPLCAVATFVLPATLALLVDATSSVDNIIAVLLLSALIMAIGAIAGSTVTAGLGALLFGVGTGLADVAAPVLLIVGAGLFATLMIHDLSGSFRRAPEINRRVWLSAATTTLSVALIGAAVFALSYVVANLSTWSAIIAPFGLVSVGIATKLAADSHGAAVRRLTKRRVRTDAGE